MNSHSPKNVMSNIHLPFISPLSPKARGVPSSGISIKKGMLKKQNTQSSIQYNQFGQIEIHPTFSPTSNGKIVGRCSIPNIRTPQSPTFKKDLYSSRNNENDNINSSSSINLLKQINLKTTFNMPNKKKIQKTKFAVKSSCLPKIGRNIISIRFDTNWENTSEICLYFIALVDKSNHQINPLNSANQNDDDDDNSQPVYIASLPEPSSLEKLESLLDSSYIKKENSIFCENFDDQKLTIFLSVHSSIEVGGIRIFNPTTKNQSAAKDVSIYVNAELCCKGQIPQNFGVNLKCNISAIESNLPLIQENQSKTDVSNNENEFSLEDQSLIPRTIAHRDKYGLLPTTPISELKIEIIETYMGLITLGEQEKNSSLPKNQNYVGINGFDILDLFGNPIYTNALMSESKEMNHSDDIKNGSIKEVNIRGISQLINCGMLLKKKKKTNNPEEMLLGEMDRTQYPTFIFTFTKPTCISKILIWNYNGNEENLKCSVRKLKIYTNNQLFWFGKIPCCDGKITNMLKSVYSIQLYEQIPNIELIQL